MLCDRAKHRLQQEFPLRRRRSPHCLLECRDRLQCACRATRVILLEHLGEEHAKGYKRSVDAISVARCYHCPSRCVREAFLLCAGDGNRMKWLENRLEELGEISRAGRI
jgi:hypothetical protein